MSAALYVGRVSHTRSRPVHHHLVYRVFMGLFDLDKLRELDRQHWAFTYNRPGLISFYDRDHGDGGARSLRAQIEEAMQLQGFAPPLGKIEILCMPRILGFVFNPLSVYFCHDETGRLQTIVHQVHNTFGERHSYVLPVPSRETKTIRQTCAKSFRVSPFLPIALDYSFVIGPPAERTLISITAGDANGPMLSASFEGARRRFTNLEMLRAWLLHPGMTFKVVAGIHWEALWIWLKLRRAKPSTGEAAAPSAQIAPTE